MLDLIVFALAVAATKFISQKHPLLSTPSSSSTTIDSNDDNNIDRSTITTQHESITRYIFQTCLLISLILFSLSILEAAPLAWLVVIDRASLFIMWYRALLWVQCILLLFVHPTFLGVIVITSLCADKPLLLSNKSSSTSISQQGSSQNNVNVQHGRGKKKKKRNNPLIICIKIVWISIRFFLVSIIWRILFRKIVGTIIPYRITRADSSDGGSSRGSGRNSKQIMVAVTFLASGYYMGSRLLLHSPDEGDNVKEDYNTQHTSAYIFNYVSLKFMVSTLCSFGMIIASVLNGFGCASLPHSNLVGLFLKPTPPSIIAKVEDDLKYAVNRLEETRWMLGDSTTQQSSSASSSTSSPARSACPSYTPSKNKEVSSSSDNQRIKQVQEEVIFLENLVADMNDDIEEMKQSQQLAMDARTSWGRIRGILGVVFSIVLIIRVILAANSFILIFERTNDDEKGIKSFNNTRDPLTSLLVYLVGRNIVNAEQYDLFRQATSLVLAGILSMTQVNAFFRVVGALGRKLSRICGTSSLQITMFTQSKKVHQGGGGQSSNVGNNVALLTSSFIMGCYFLACVTVVKMNLPIEYRSSFSTAVGLNFDFNTTMLNMIFFASSCVSATILASLFGIQHNNSERYQLESQLSSSMLTSQLA